MAKTVQTVTPQASSTPSCLPERIVIASGTLEAMKWLALLSMTADHVNKAVLEAEIAWLAAFGRLALPLFAFVLAYNLARPNPMAVTARMRTMQRLALFGLAAMPFHGVITPLAGYVLPLNILFSLLLATALIAFLERGERNSELAAIALFLIGGAMVDYLWFGLALCLLAWRYCQRPSKARLIALLAAFAALCLFNGNAWALLALPILLAAPRVALPVPRLRHVFYAYYPLHLMLLWAYSYFYGVSS